MATKKRKSAEKEKGGVGRFSPSAHKWNEDLVADVINEVLNILDKRTFLCSQTYTPQQRRQHLSSCFCSIAYSTLLMHNALRLCFTLFLSSEHVGELDGAHHSAGADARRGLRAAGHAGRLGSQREAHSKVVHHLLERGTPQAGILD